MMFRSLIAGRCPRNKHKGGNNGDTQGDKVPEQVHHVLLSTSARVPRGCCFSSGPSASLPCPQRIARASFSALSQFPPLVGESLLPVECGWSPLLFGRAAQRDH